MLRRASVTIAMVLASCLTGHVLAAENGLGSRWPNAKDVSASPNWHVYVFQQSGVKYIQVNDLNGTVREVIATAGDQFLVLPMGADATRIAVPNEHTSTSAKSAAQTAEVSAATNGPAQLIYRDDSISITMQADSSGNPLWKNTAAPATCGPPDCGTVNPQQAN